MNQSPSLLSDIQLASLRQDEIEKQKEEYFKNGGEITVAEKCLTSKNLPTPCIVWNQYI